MSNTAALPPHSIAVMPTQTTITTSFEITGWDETTYDAPAEGPKLTRATVRKRFSGPLQGTSVGELLSAQGERGSGYLASERVEGMLDGRSGTFVIQHGGILDETDQRAFGHIVPGSGTGALERLRGDAVFAHDDEGARLTLTFSL
jgi:Protein of unknown function (DUF3224)